MQHHFDISVPTPRIAAIHDLSGFGRASLTVIIPILSSMGIQVCPLPTAILSSQTTGMKDFTFFDLTSQMSEILDHWKSMSLDFDAVYSGFLGSPEQVELVIRCAKEHCKRQSITVVDPVLGDDGVLDPTQSQEMVESMRKLIRHADIITPNLTEASFLLGTPYEKNISSADLKEYLRKLADMGPKIVLITSATAENQRTENQKYIRSVAYDAQNQKFWQVTNPYIHAYYPGTGDTFTSVFLGSLLQKDSVPMSMAKAAQFVHKAILTSYGYDTPSTEGIMLEKVLPSLNTQIPMNYEAF